jgi:hypothetical protein
LGGSEEENENKCGDHCFKRKGGGGMDVCYPQHTLLGELESQAELLKKNLNVIVF